MKLVLADVQKSFAKRLIIRGVSLVVHPGEVVVLMGASGSGKSTLLRLCAGLILPDQGSVRLSAPNVHTADAESRVHWPFVTAVQQEINLWPHLTALENVALPLRRTYGAKAVEEAERALAAVGARVLGPCRAGRLSRGEAQLVAIARALAVKPRVLLLDEATASLDLERASNVVNLIRQLAASGTALLVVTHQLGIATTAADRVAFLHEGTIAEEGLADILVNPSTDELQRFLLLTRKVG